MSQKLEFAYNVQSTLRDGAYGSKGMTLEHTVHVGKWEHIFHRGVDERSFNKVAELNFSTSGKAGLDPSLSIALHPYVLPSYLLENYGKDGWREIYERSAGITFYSCGGPRITSCAYSHWDTAQVFKFLGKVFDYEWTAGTRKWFDKLTVDKQNLIYNMDSFSRFMLHIHLAGAVHITRDTSEQWRTYTQHHQFSKENMLDWLYYSKALADENLVKHQAAQVQAQA